MIRGEQLTAVIPVRAGSKGIPGKNLLRLGRDTLLERTIKLAKACPYVDRTLVTTDSPEMHAIARAHGVEAPGLRPAELAADDAKTVDVVRHLMQTADIGSGYILLLQVTSPLRTLADVTQLCADFDAADRAVQSIVSLVAHTSPHPDKIQKIENGRVLSYLGKESMVARQLLPPVYALNGAFYLTHVEVLRQKGTFVPVGATMPYVMPEERSLNLDGKMDLLLLDALVKSGQVTIEEYDAPGGAALEASHH